MDGYGFVVCAGLMLIGREARSGGVFLTKQKGRRVLMRSKSRKSDCDRQCNANFLECIQRGEHESICRMKVAQCRCGCRA